MAPVVTTTAGPVHKSRNLPRIVPAIPHRLTRSIPAARPVTPDASSKGTARHDADADGDAPEQPVGTAATSEQEPRSAAEPPITPDSPASVAAKVDVETPLLAASPAQSVDDHVEHALEAAAPDDAPLPNHVPRKLPVPAELPPPFYPARNSCEHASQDSGPLETVLNGYVVPRHPPGFLPPELPSVVYSGHSHAVHLANGTGSSHPQSPSKSQTGEHISASERTEDIIAVPYQNGPSFKTEPLQETPFELAAYLSGQFGNPEFADFILQVRSLEATLVSIPVHGIVAVRSPVIAEAVGRSLPSSHRPRETRRLLDILTTDPFVTRESIEEAMRVLYGAPLLSAQVYLYGLSPHTHDGVQPPLADAPRRMRQLLNYIAAGRALQLSSMQHRGMEIVRALLRWDTIDQVLEFGLRFNTGHVSVTENAGPKDPFDAALVHFAIDFMAHFLPVDFKLYTLAPELSNLPRLPPFLDSRPSTHNPRLSKIRFGDAPPEDELKPTYTSLVLSTVLLTLPLTLIDRILNHPAAANRLGWSGIVNIMQHVVNEREDRRKKAVVSQVKLPRNETVANALLEQLHTKEHLKRTEPSPLHPSGYTFVTTRADDHI